MPTDLVVLAADKDIEFGLRGLLQRSDALGIRRVEFKIYVHPQHDPGCATRAHDFLRGFSNEYHHAIVVFDHHGCGREGDLPAVIARSVRERLTVNGWNDRAEVIVISPELEVWAFGSSVRTDQAIGWHKDVRLRDWLRDIGLWIDGSKPEDPKAALLAALRSLSKPRSSALYGTIADLANLDACEDRQFQTLRSILQRWFPSS